ncbi:hypothetical protein WJX82_003740 [Trebouxia sp. C0006]
MSDQDNTQSAGSDGCQEATKVASEVEDAGNKEADTRTSAVPQEVPDTMTNAAPGSCTGIVQSNSGAPMRVPGSGLHATSGNLVVGLFHSLEGAQQRQPLFGINPCS